jgi:D-alanine-D-alanine ligase
MQKDKKIMVVFGGPSSEAEVSKRTSAAVFKAVKNLGYNAIETEFSKNIISDIQKENPDIIYNAMHGAYGEDGCLQGLLECLKIPYTHSGVRASAIAMDKFFTKIILQPNGVNSAKGKIYTRSEIEKENFAKPCVIKPVDDGSSVGVIILKQNEKLDISKLSNANRFLVEDFIEGRELSIAVLDGVALGVVEIRPKSGVYDYKSKYTSGASEYLVPAPISKNIEEIAFEYAQKAHNILGCKGVSRSDIIYSEKENKLYFLEINTHPGMTETSLVPKIAAQKNVSFESLVETIISSASNEICI